MEKTLGLQVVFALMCFLVAIFFFVFFLSTVFILGNPPFILWFVASFAMGFFLPIPVFFLTLVSLCFVYGSWYGFLIASALFFLASFLLPLISFFLRPLASFLPVFWFSPSMGIILASKDLRIGFARLFPFLPFGYWTMVYASLSLSSVRFFLSGILPFFFLLLCAVSISMVLASLLWTRAFPVYGLAPIAVACGILVFGLWRPR